MSRRQSYNKEKVRLSFRRKSPNNNLTNLVMLIGITLIVNTVKWQVSKMQSPTVESNETGMSIFQLYSKEPNTQNCSEGILNNSEKQKVLNRLNYIRGLHGLPTVFYNSNNDNLTAKLALALAVNIDKFERPNSSFKCWSGQAGIGVNDSLSYSIIYSSTYSQISSGMNLYRSENFVDALLMDSRRENSAGSRWLLNPFLKSISFGRVDGEPLVAKTTTVGYDGETIERKADYVSEATINFSSDEQQNLADLNVKSTAYPIGEYPKELFEKGKYQHGYPPMLFYVIAFNKKIVRQQDVNFSNSSVQISNENGESLEVNSLQREANNKDLPNMLTWKVNQIKQGAKYIVTVKNVKVFDTVINYEYWFRLK